MHRKVFSTLEFNKILELIANYALSPMAKSKILAIEPFDQIDEINMALKETTDTTNLLVHKGDFPLRGIKDIREIIQRLAIQGTLSIAEVLSVADVLRSSAQAVSYYTSAKEYIDTLSLASYFQTLNALPALSKEINRCVVSEDEISDQASSRLYDIRRDIKGSSAKIKSQLNKIIHSAGQAGMLQDNNYTIRNDRYCVPLKAEYRGQFKGMIHDQSSTGSTLFVEPLALVELNNHLSSLYLDEEKEIQKILMDLSEKIAVYKDVLEENIDMLTHLDFLSAKANYSIHTKSSCPVFNEDYYIYLEKARHPLLDPHDVVPTTIYLGKDFTTLVITGPNTGGKTVTLKTIGLLSLMGQSGLHVPAADGAKLTVLDNIFADIGDEQSIEQSLSTFSSHMTNITQILEQVTDRSLVLFDELGAGTDPTEGAALAMAILENLKAANILTIATTHYSELKVYALSTDGVENASCEFDVNTLRPTYKLLIGIPGKSNAFAISKRLGLSDIIIEEAKELLSGREIRFEDLITDLETNKKTALLEKERARQYREEAEMLQKQVEQQKRQLTSQKQQILNDAKMNAARLLENSKEEADAIIRRMNDLVKDGTGMNMSELEAQRTKLREKLNKTTKQKNSSRQARKKIRLEDMEIGSGVFVTTLNQKGTLLDINTNKKEATVQLGIMKSTIPFKDLELADENVSYTLPQKGTAKKYTIAKGNKNKGTTSVSAPSHVKTEVDLRGLMISDAITVLDKYIDDAYLAHLSQVTIIHGKGTGALRQGVHQFLRTTSHVKDYRLGEYGEGDSGVTIVTFND